MSKIICDVCGTHYPESAEQCPICGCVRAGGGKTAADSFVMEEAQVPARSHEHGGHFSKSNVRKRNKNAARYEMQAERVKAKPAQQTDEDYLPADDGSRSNTVLNILLVVVILALLLVTGFIFMKYFLPNLTAEPETTVPTTEAVIETEEPTEEPTEAPTVPCTGLELANGTNQIVLTERGQAWLLNLQVTPEDTTDELIYIPSDENVVTVDEQGCVTAVGEGEAVITAICGDYQVEFDVICIFVNETDPDEKETEADGKPAVEETEAPTEAPTEPLKDVTLSVKVSDMTFKMIGQQTTVKLTCDLTNQEVTFTSENEKVITVDENGVITCVGWGTTNVIVSYGDQEVEIICRCVR